MICFDIASLICKLVIIWEVIFRQFKFWLFVPWWNTVQRRVYWIHMNVVCLRVKRLSSYINIHLIDAETHIVRYVVVYTWFSALLLIRWFILTTAELLQCFTFLIFFAWRWFIKYATSNDRFRWIQTFKLSEFAESSIANSTSYAISLRLISIHTIFIIALIRISLWRVIG